MTQPRIVELPAFTVFGRKTWISGQDNSQFTRFWDTCQQTGLFTLFDSINHSRPGRYTNGTRLGVSLVADNPAIRQFYYMIAIEHSDDGCHAELEVYQVPASRWAIFRAYGVMPESLVKAEMYAFMEWLPTSGFQHAAAPEIEVYPPAEVEGDHVLCEFWLPIEPLTT